MQKMLPKIIVGVLLFGAIAFYGGMKFGESKAITTNSGTFAQGQQRGNGQFGGANGNARMGGGNRAGVGMGSGFVNGEVVSADANSMTVKMRDGSSKIIILSASTQILKSATGTLTDVAVGSQITVTGGPNSDGSITAQSIQIRPNMPSSTSITK